MMNSNEEIFEKEVIQEEEKEEKKKDCKKEKKEKCKKNEQVEKLEKEKAELNDKLLRVTAEMQNMKRRYDDEISRIYKYDGEDLVKKLLPVIDNFERAILMDDTNLEDEVSKFLSGFKMIYANMKDILKGKGIEEIECLNKEFDPTKMDAILTEKVEGTESNVVIDVLQKGYIYNDKVIRPAMVKVSE